MHFPSCTIIDFHVPIHTHRYFGTWTPSFYYKMISACHHCIKDTLDYGEAKSGLCQVSRQPFPLMQKIKLLYSPFHITLVIIGGGGGEAASKKIFLIVSFSIFCVRWEKNKVWIRFQILKPGSCNSLQLHFPNLYSEFCTVTC